MNVTALSDTALVLATDPVFVSWGSSALTTFALMVALNAVLDKSKVLWGIRCQPYKETLSGAEYLDCACTAVLNLGMLHWPISLPLFQMWKDGPGPAREFDWGTALMHVVVCGLVIEVWFYWTHRLLHYGSLYRMIHKKHHKYTAPAAIVAVYAHPLEFLIGNYMGVALGPVVTGCHPSVGVFWYTVTIFGTCMTHSGYDYWHGTDLSAHHHDMHHEFFNCNFGVMFTRFRALICGNRSFTRVLRSAGCATSCSRQLKKTSASQRKRKPRWPSTVPRKRSRSRRSGCIRRDLSNVEMPVSQTSLLADAPRGASRS